MVFVDSLHKGKLSSSVKREILLILLPMWSFQRSLGVQDFQVCLPIIPARKCPILQLDLGLIFGIVYNR